MPVRSANINFRPRPLSSSMVHGSGLFRSDLIPSSGDSYTLSQLGSGTTGAGITVDTGYMKYVINGGLNQGAIGSGDVGTGIQFDETGTGTYGSVDVITPGTEWESFAFYIDNSYYLGGSNSANYPGTTHYFNTQTTTIWNLSTGNKKHVVCLKGAADKGYVVIQYITVGKELAIRMRMSYTNTTGSSVTVKAARLADPDQDSGGPDTNNTRGYDTLPVGRFVSSTGATNSKIFAVYIPPTGTVTNSTVFSSWPGYDISTMLSDSDSSNGDHAIGVAWDGGTVAAGATVNFNCAYLCGSSLAAMKKSMGLV